MYLFKLLLKLLAWPLMIVVKLILWFSIYLTQLSGIVFNILSGIVFFIAILGFMFGTDTKSEVIRTLLIGFVIFMIPRIGNWLIVKIAILENTLHDFIQS